MRRLSDAVRIDSKNKSVQNVCYIVNFKLSSLPFEFQTHPDIEVQLIPFWSGRGSIKGF